MFVALIKSWITQNQTTRLIKNIFQKVKSRVKYLIEGLLESVKVALNCSTNTKSN